MDGVVGKLLAIRKVGQECCPCLEVLFSQLG